MAHSVSSYVSMEQALEEDRRDNVDLLVAPALPTRQRGNSLSSIPENTASLHAPSALPVRTMLDISDDEELPVIRHSSLPENNAREVMSHGPLRSMFDIETPPRPVRMPDGLLLSKAFSTSPKSYRKTYGDAQHHHRSQSDASGKAHELSRLGPATSLSGFWTSGNNTLPRRSNNNKRAVPSALGEALRGELGSLSPMGMVKRRSNSTTSLSSSGDNTTRRPSTPLSAGLQSGTGVPDEAASHDTNTAYRKLGDAALAVSTGGLSLLVKSRRRSKSNTSARRKSDVADIEQAVLDSSDEDSSDDNRGRRTRAKGGLKGDSSASAKDLEDEALRKTGTGKTAPYRNRVEPAITVTAPHAHKATAVHPHTSFDHPAAPTPHDSDHEDIRRAQRMTITMTPIISATQTSRSVRTLYRGNFLDIQDEAHEHQRRVRKYLVATDLSEEAAHALEWTIGTVLRDGDTLLAIYCVDEDIGVSSPDLTNVDGQLREQAAAVAASTRASATTPVISGGHTNPSPMTSSTRLASAPPGSSTGSPMGRVGKAEQERERAVTDITERVTRLLRKTKLQVKVVIEVIACKSPKHLITEVIDFINPTLVVLGSRGRSALKGYVGESSW